MKYYVSKLKLTNKSTKHLSYFVNYNKTPINFNLWEGEMYYNAIPIQQMIGQLVYYSNFGRYELRLAKSWKRIDLKTWSIELQPNLFCENGEEINATSFKKSIERSLLLMSKTEEIPILKYLKDYDKFKESNTKKNINNYIGIDSIEVGLNNNLIFYFDKPISDGVLQILSFPQFGYISKENYNEDGSWADDKKFVSSGPYKLSHFVNKNEVVLDRNPHWNLEYNTDAPETIQFIQKEKSNLELDDTSQYVYSIFDSFSKLVVNETETIEVVPEYFKGIALGNFEKGIFKRVENREAFKSTFNYYKEEIKYKHKNIRFSDWIYPFKSNEKNIPAKSEQLIKSTLPLTIYGTEPTNSSRNWLPWQVLKKTLDHFKLNYKFTDETYSRNSYTNNDYDLRIVGPSVGGRVEAWILEILFCSHLNANLPDIDNKISSLINKFYEGAINKEELEKYVFQYTNEDSSILYFNHFGVNLYTRNIDTSTISSTFSVLRLDQIGLK